MYNQHEQEGFSQGGFTEQRGPEADDKWIRSKESALAHMHQLLLEFQPTGDVREDTVRFLKITSLFQTGPRQVQLALLESDQRSPEWLLQDTIQANEAGIQSGYARSGGPEQRYFFGEIAELEVNIAKDIIAKAREVASEQSS